MQITQCWPIADLMLLDYSSVCLAHCKVFIPVAEFLFMNFLKKFQVLIFCSNGSLQTICSLWICLSGGFSFHDHFVNGQSRFDCFGLLLLAQELKIGFFWFLLELSMFISSFSLEFCE